MCYGTTASPTTNCAVVTGIDTSQFTRNIAGLTAGTTYYFRGYATNANGTFYSSDATFVTIPPTPTGFVAGASGCGNNWLNLSWNVSP